MSVHYHSVLPFCENNVFIFSFQNQNKNLFYNLYDFLKTLSDAFYN